MRRVINYLLFLALCVPPLLVSALPAGGGTVNTYDFFQNVEAILQTAEQKLIEANTYVNNNLAVVRIRNQIRQIEEARKRMTQLQRQYDALTGKYGYGRWLDGPALALTHKGRPKTNEDLIQALRDGHATGEMAHDRDAWVNVYLPPNPHSKRVEVNPTPNTSQQQALIDSTGSLYMMGNHYYNETSKRMKIINELTQKMDETDNLKQSMDLLNANVLALHSTIEDMLTLQALMAKRASAVDQGTVNQNRDEQRFMQWRE